MLIRCQKCNFENQLGAIFCRSCGEKLDLEQMSPEALKKGEKKERNTGKTIRKIVTVLLFLLVLGVAAALFLPVGHEEYQEPSAEAGKTAKEKYDKIALFVEHGSRGQKFAFTADELTALFNAQFIASAEKTDGGGVYLIEKVQCKSADDDQMEVQLYTKLAGSIPVLFSITGAPSMEDGNVVFTVSSAKMGHLPMSLDFLKKQVTDKYLPLIDSKVRKILENTDSMSVDDGKLEIQLKKPAKK